MSTPPEFDVTIETTSPGVLVVRVVGELDMSTCERVGNALSSAPPAPRVIVDLTSCTFIDSSGIRVLVAAHRDATAGSGRVELVAADPNIVRVFEITGVSTMMTVHPTLDAAL